MKDQTTDMMKDFADHRDEEINVRLVGSAKSIDFVLTDTVKNTLLDMYDLYVAGGGMRSGNMYQISEFDQVYVEKTENVSLAMLLQLFLTLQLGIYLLISDFTERPAGRSFCKTKSLPVLPGRPHKTYFKTNCTTIDNANAMPDAHQIILWFFPSGSPRCSRPSTSSTKKASRRPWIM